MKKFYEAVQKGASGRPRTLGFFKKKKNAKEYLQKFNTKVEVYPVGIEEREFMD